MRCRACDTILEQEELFNVLIGKYKDNVFVSKEVLNDMCFTCLAEAEIYDEAEIKLAQELRDSGFVTKTKENEK